MNEKFVTICEFLKMSKIHTRSDGNEKKSNWSLNCNSFLSFIFNKMSSEEHGQIYTVVSLKD